MAWLQLETNIGKRPPETIEHMLEELGAVAITLQDAGDHPLLEPAPGETPVWPEIILTALFSDGTSQDHICAALDGHVNQADMVFSRLHDEDWQARFENDLSPQQFGARFWITPDEGSVLPANATRLVLPPGMAFGTGQHPTTAMCLKWLESLDLRAARVLDYGCGSGILGLAAIALGAPSACLIDIDPQALQASADNAARNNLSARVNILPPDKSDNSVRFNILLANILSGTLIDLGRDLEQLMAPGAGMAITGILADQADGVIAAWSEWASMSVSDQTRDWVLLTGVKL